VKAQGDEAEADIMYIFQKLTGSKATVAAAVNLPPVAAPSLPPTLHGIIRRAKNAKSAWHAPALQVASSTRTKRRRYHNVIQPGRPTWDPGGDQDPDPECKLFKIKVPLRVYSLLATIMAADVDLVLDDEDMEAEQSRTELDSHANMPVVGRHAFIISDTGRVADVNAFTPDYEPMQLSIVDAAIQYDCPYDGQSYILVIRNTLVHVPSMKNNLMPPLVMREAGIKVYNTPKIQVAEPTIKDHSICFPETGFRISLSLWGMFSYFPTTKPTALFMKETEDIYLLTPSRWNPHDDLYATNEENMLDWEGNTFLSHLV
jgi:hypothetical protein